MANSATNVFPVTMWRAGLSEDEDGDDDDDNDDFDNDDFWF